MFGGIDPKKMQSMMKQMGIKQDDIDALRVIIEKNDGNNIIIENPHVARITMQGQESWQITGEAREETAGVDGEDVRLIMEKTGKSYEESKAMLERVEGDIAQAIISLSE
ncbi:nascent polypeptide-associated complex protein [Candidatus Pacearchaeota archaeon]|nr:nascent polypeptide-associated complex protein [Candidatus Pacearchaeota archaeon]